MPRQTALQGIYPNPFKQGSVTNIEIIVKASETASVTIYNIAGQRVRNYPLSVGSHLLDWDGKDQKGLSCGCGIYLVRLGSDRINQSAKLIMIK